MDKIRLYINLEALRSNYKRFGKYYIRISTSQSILG